MSGKMEKYRILANFSWVITSLAMIFIYGGFHPNTITSNFIKCYGLILVLLANMPIFFSNVAKLFSRSINLKDILLILISLTVQIYLLI